MAMDYVDEEAKALRIRNAKARLEKAKLAEEVARTKKLQRDKQKPLPKQSNGFHQADMLKSEYKKAKQASNRAGIELRRLTGEPPKIIRKDFKY